MKASEVSVAPVTTSTSADVAEIAVGDDRLNFDVAPVRVGYAPRVGAVGVLAIGG
jgi:hypothetical protein